MKFEILLFVCTFGVFGKKEDKENETIPDYLVTCECSLNSAVNPYSGKVDINHTAGCPYPNLDELKKKYPEPEIHMKKAYTSLYNKTENKYYCQVRGGYCIDIAIWQPDDPEKMNKDTGYPCHERSCASKVNNIKGCVEHEIAKEAGNSCNGQYGEDKKRKSGSFGLEIAGIAHVPLRDVHTDCNPLCMSKDDYSEKKKLQKLACKRGCSFSRVFCCTDDYCNTDQSKDTRPYENFLYDEWQDKLEEAIITGREYIFNSTSNFMLSKLNLNILLALTLLFKK